MLLVLWKYKHGIEPGLTADIRTVASDLEVSLGLLEVAEMKWVQNAIQICSITFYSQPVGFLGLKELDV